MFCSSCGQPLVDVAHIINEKLLCETCFQKLHTYVASDNVQQHTILYGQHDDKERERASQEIPKENVPQVFSYNSTNSSPVSQASTNYPISSEQQTPAQVANPIQHAQLLLASEQILWKRIFSKGILHRESTFTEAVTNLRVLCIDDRLKAIVRAAPLQKCNVVVTNTRRDYTGLHTGFERYGSFAGTSSGSRVTLGDVQFLFQGRIAL